MTNTKFDQTNMKATKGSPMITSSFGFEMHKRRNHSLLCGEMWLDDRRENEGAEGLWRIHDELYDLNDFINVHPGGKAWIEMTKGTDITEAFETHHIRGVAEKILPKYFERKAKTPRIYPFTFHENGFYKTMKKRIKTQLEKIPNKYAIQSQIIADSLFFTYLLTAWLATYIWSLSLGLFSGIVLSYTAIAAHNFFHKKDNFRMYYFDFTMMSSREWRISHAMSHHLYTNTVNDLEISLMEPYFYWLPFKKNRFISYLSWVYSPVIYIFLFYGSWVKTIFGSYQVHKVIRKTSLLPFSILILMYCGTNRHFYECIIMFLWIIGCSSLHFSLVGVNAAHHHPMLFHDGDAIREKDEMDFGVFQMDAVSDRKDINSSPLLIITHFGDHALHHLFPTIDHGKLKYLHPTFIETCEEFGVEWRCSTQLELVKGQYLQLTRDVNENPPKKLKKIVA